MTTERCESAAWTLQSCLLLNLVCVCEFCLPVCLHKLSAALFICVRACVLTVSSFARKMSLRKPTARCHSLSKVSECCFPQTKWSHPVCDSNWPHRFILDWVDSSSFLIQMEHSSGLRNKNNCHILIILGHKVKKTKQSNFSEKVKPGFYALCTILLHMTGCYHQWWLTVTSIEVPFLVSQHCNTRYEKAAPGLI